VRTLGPIALLLLAVAAPAATPPAPPSTAAAFDHVAIHVVDAARSVAFYRALFDLQEVPAPVPMARWLRFGDGTTLHIIPGRPEPVALGKWDHIALACADMGAMIRRLDAHKIAWEDIGGRHTPQTRGDGVQQIFVRDPDGYWIEINDRLKQR
jgi:lactoylglutathione lyase